MLKNILASLSMEILKLRKSTIFKISTGMSIFIAFILGLMMVLIIHSDILPPGVLKTKVNLAAIKADWPAYLDFTQIAAGAIGMILFGFAVSWLFGREFTDRTIKDVLALPVSRTAIVLSKIIAVWLWCLFLSMIIFIVSIAVGALIGLPLWSPDLLPKFIRIYFMATFLSIALCPAGAFIASAGRGYLPAIGFVVLCMGLANLFANIGLGAYFPWSIPMMYTGAMGTDGTNLPAASYLIVIATCLAGIAGTICHWEYADQNK